ncbi:MAG TPA: class I tRNA ligase family protein, partial [Dehalococcoidia bacterium]|nr:class I tRNA ligase family protein [Dehalococcoidia bacterium]
MAPACPHIAEELWERSGREYSVHQQSWPEADADLARSEAIELAVQVNGKVRARLQVPAGSDEDAVRELAEADASVAQHIADKTVRRVIFVPDRLLNIVVG